MLIRDGVNVASRCAADADRMEPFETWPDYMPVKKKDLDETGMIYTGVGNSVRCYFCGDGLGDWKRRGIPIEEHARWYPICKQILSVQGHAYTETSSQRRKEEEFSSDHVSEVGSEINPLESVAAQSCLEMDFPEEMVKQAIDIYCQRNGGLNFKAKDLCEILFEIEESHEKQCADIIVAIATPELVTDEDEDISVLFDHLTRENRCKKCMHNQEHMTLLAYNHLLRCPQCAPCSPFYRNFYTEVPGISVQQYISV